MSEAATDAASASDIVLSARPVARQVRATSITRLLAPIRLHEVLTLQGSPILGAILAAHGPALSNLATAVALIAGSCCLVAHVFLLNDWAGIEGDLRDSGRAARAFTSKGADRDEVRVLAMAVLVASLLIFAWLGPTVVALALAIAGSSALYSAPGLHLKGQPIANSVLHLVGGELHFLLGYAAFAAIDLRGIAIGLFFGLVFTAGHYMHETRDHDGDLINGIRTNSVAFGRMRCFAAGFATFTLAYGLLIALALDGLVPKLVLASAALYPLHAYATYQAMRADLASESLGRLQRWYHCIFALIGLLLLAG
jgi:4-hydroxybenzoate polyprenyltransferase